MNEIKQIDCGDGKIDFLPIDGGGVINNVENGVAHTIKANYYKTSLANLTRSGSFGATGIIQAVKEAGDRMAELKRIGNIYGENVGTGHAGNVWDKNGLAPTLISTEGGNKQPMIIEGFYENRDARVYEEVAPSLRSERSGLKTIEEVGINDRGFKENAPQVSVGTVPTLRAQTHGNLPKVIVAMRGRKPEADANWTQQLEMNDEGLSNSLTTVQTDNLLLEGKPECKAEEKIKIKQATKQGFIECKAGGVADFSYPESKLRRGRVQGGGDISPTLTSSNLGVCKVESRYRIRKLTPRECWRLMGFSDCDFEKAQAVNSNTQLYKQAGNSIVKNVLMAIFGQMIER